MTLPLAADFPKRGPKNVPEWVWGRFLNAVRYREVLQGKALVAPAGSAYGYYLGHEIKRTEIEIGLWLGRMMEMEEEAGAPPATQETV